MSWKLEIYRAFFVAFGIFEIISNISFLYLSNGLDNAAKLHQEIPRNVTKNKLKTKVIFMLSFGVLFFCVGLSSYISHSINEIYYLIVLILFAVYAVGEAIYYRYWKTFGFSIVSILLLLIFL